MGLPSSVAWMSTRSPFASYSNVKESNAGMLLHGHCRLKDAISERDSVTLKGSLPACSAVVSLSLVLLTPHLPFPPPHSLMARFPRHRLGNDHYKHSTTCQTIRRAHAGF